MSRLSPGWWLFASVLLATPVSAQVLDFPSPPFDSAVSNLAEAQPAQDKPKPPPVDQTPSPPPRSEPYAGLNPHMIGDLPISGFLPYSIVVPGFATLRVPFVDANGQISTRLVFVPVPGVPRDVFVPIIGRGPFKIGENESPFPQCRIFAVYNYFSGLRGPDSEQLTFQQPITFGNKTTIAPVTIPSVSSPAFALQRLTFGFEKTFLDGNASVGLRVPLLQIDGPSPFGQQQTLGDLTAIIKYAPWRNDNGSGFSTGLAVTAPTGPSIQTPSGDVNPTIIQPFVGYLLNGRRFYLHGFSSVAVPTDPQDVTWFFNDIGVGYWLYRGDGDRPITAIVPTLEAHFTTPLNHRSGSDAISGIDVVVLTGGVHIGINNRSTLTLSIGSTCSGPRLFNLESLVQFNMRF